MVKSNTIKNESIKYVMEKTNTIYLKDKVHDEAVAMQEGSQDKQLPFRMKTLKYLFPRGNEPLLYHQIGNRNIFIFITNQ